MAQELTFETPVEVNRAVPEAVAEAVLAKGLTIESLTALLVRYWKAGYEYAVQTRIRGPVMEVVEEIRRGRGRPRVHVDDAAKQKAFRDRRKQEEDMPSSDVEEGEHL